MKLIIYAKSTDDKIIELASLGDREKFYRFVGQAIERKKDTESAKVLELFIKGHAIRSRDIGDLMRALRHFDEDYLCNEIHEVLEELDIKVSTIGLDNTQLDNVADLSIYDI